MDQTGRLSYQSNDLIRLARKYGVDKWGCHWYVQHYHNHFKHLRRRKINLLEIGVGGYEDARAGGESLRMWQEYFPKATIYGIDIFDKSLLEHGRIKIRQGSQDDEVFLKAVAQEVGSFDIVIDDGSHVNAHVIKSFRVLFPMLSNDGIYAVEDLQTSYWPPFGGSSHDLSNKSTSVGFFKGMIDSLNYEEFLKPDYQPNYFDKHIVAVHFYHNLILVHKGANNEGSSLLRNNSAVDATGTDLVADLASRIGAPKVRRSNGARTRTVNAGFVHHQAGRLDRAEALYRKALQKDPNHAEALHLLGVIAHQRGYAGAAVALIERALLELRDLPAAHVDFGNALQAAGRLAEAAQSYRRAIGLDPDYGMAHNNLARTLNEQGLFEAALESSGRAVALIPEFAGAHLNRAAALIGVGRVPEAEAPLHQALAMLPDRVESWRDLALVLTACGRFDEAADCYRRALALDPDHPDTHYNLGKALQQQNRPDDAVNSYRQALALRPDYPEAHNNLGAALQALGRLPAAVKSYRRALALRPDYAEAHYNLGRALQERKRLNLAANSYHRAIRLKPDFAEAHNNLGNALRELGRLDEAVASFETALALAPDCALAYNGLGNALLAQYRLNEAEASYRRALALDPDYAAAHNNLGTALQAQGRIDKAITSYQRALALRPNFALAHYSLGLVRNVQEELDEALACLERAMALDPRDANALIVRFELRQRICDWSGYWQHEARVRSALLRQPTVATAFTMLALSSTPEEQINSARRVAAKIPVPGGAELSHSRRRPGERIRLGYLSADFHQHPVAYLIAELIERHDRRRFELIGYSCGPPDQSALRARLAAAVDRFVDVGALPHRQSAELIHADAVDILVDLTGYTGEGRPAILACRPAPIQVNYLGYTATTGADFIDYIIADRFVVPPDQQPFYSEKLVYLPNCYQPSDTTRAIAEPGPRRAECGLPEEGFVFCCFNNSYKINPQFFDIWTRLLDAVPGSVLWLPAANRWAKANLAHEAAARGMAPDRLVFAPRTAGTAEHLARLRCADLFLDTLPFNAHTTANDALWAGLPVLTCAGNTFAGRVAGSLLTSAGLPELIAHSPEEYASMALRLATEPDRLAGLRLKLARNRSKMPLFNIAGYTRDIERAFGQMWDTWMSGRPPAAFSVSSATDVTT